MRPQMLNMEQLLNQKPSENTRKANEPFGKSKTDLECAFGRIKMSEETTRSCTLESTGKRQERMIQNQTRVLPCIRHFDNTNYFERLITKHL